MLVFLSWSGPRSKAVAQALESWLRQVIQAVEPWISSDIDKGLRWGPEISARLEQSKVGIICLTKDNLDAKWILFEAGALSKTKDAHVCTLLLDVKPSDVEQPLAQFQHTGIGKDEIHQLLKTVNRLLERPLPDGILNEVFETNWPRLENLFKEAVELPVVDGKTERKEAEILQEILELVRNQDRRSVNIGLGGSGLTPEQEVEVDRGVWKITTTPPQPMSTFVLGGMSDKQKLIVLKQFIKEILPFQEMSIDMTASDKDTEK